MVCYLFLYKSSRKLKQKKVHILSSIQCFDVKCIIHCFRVEKIPLLRDQSAIERILYFIATEVLFLFSIAWLQMFRLSILCFELFTVKYIMLAKGLIWSRVFYRYTSYPPPQKYIMLAKGLIRTRCQRILPPQKQHHQQSLLSFFTSTYHHCRATSYPPSYGLYFRVFSLPTFSFASALVLSCLHRVA
jgi:hypothetical protein